jgi:hypothetical protein
MVTSRLLTVEVGHSTVNCFIWRSVAVYVDSFYFCFFLWSQSLPKFEGGHSGLHKSVR